MPCIECNRSIKFRDLLATARELGAQALATDTTSPRAASPTIALVCAADADRDQSYFRSRPRASSSIICAFRSAT